MERGDFSNNHRQACEAKMRGSVPEWPSQSFRRGTDLVLSAAAGPGKEGEEQKGPFTSNETEPVDSTMRWPHPEIGQKGGKPSGADSDGEGGTKELP